MLQSIKRALKVNASDPRLHGCLIRFQKFVEERSAGFAGPVNQVLDQETQSIFTTKSAKERNEQFIQSHSNTLDHRVVGKSVDRCMYLEGDKKRLLARFCWSFLQHVTKFF